MKQQKCPEKALIICLLVLSFAIDAKEPTTHYLLLVIAAGWFAAAIRRNF